MPALSIAGVVNAEEGHRRLMLLPLPHHVYRSLILWYIYCLLIELILTYYISRDTSQQ